MEVLPAAGLPELDCNSNCLPAELEVRKLQQLVRRLELQNEQLRASGCSGGPSPGFGLGSSGAFRLHGPLLALRCLPSAGSLSPPEEPFEYFQPHGAGDGASEPGEDEAEPSVLDELELLDLEVLCCPEEEETWLYASSKAVELGDDSLTPLQWCRHVLDRPKSEVEAARRSLSLRLEQAPLDHSRDISRLEFMSENVSRDLFPSLDRLPHNNVTNEDEQDDNLTSEL